MRCRTQRDVIFLHCKTNGHCGCQTKMLAQIPWNRDLAFAGKGGLHRVDSKSVTR